MFGPLVNETNDALADFSDEELALAERVVRAVVDASTVAAEAVPEAEHLHPPRSEGDGSWPSRPDQPS